HVPRLDEGAVTVADRVGDQSLVDAVGESPGVEAVLELAIAVVELGVHVKRVRGRPRYREAVADVETLLELAVKLAGRAGRLLLEEAPERADDVSTKSSRTDMVTAVDRASEALIVGTLEKERPDDGVLGGEGGQRPGTSGARWAI